ncbi:MAG: Fe-S cluster assembly protein SufB [Candidatus Saccharibacteria bacterium]
MQDFKLPKDIVYKVSKAKKEPKWMLDFRLKALDAFNEKPMPKFGPDLNQLDFSKLDYYEKPVGKYSSWDEMPEDLRSVYEKIGVPEADKNFLSGTGAMYDSEVIYNTLKTEWEEMGVIFTDIETGLREHPELFKEYFSKIVPINDNKFASLNSALWSGGSFIYIPKGVKIDKPLQAYFRINTANLGQFERTLIIADEDSYVHYIEGCSAPIYTEDALHAGVIEIIVKKGARVRYTTIQNWSTNVYNLTTQRMHVYENGFGEWVDGNIGSKITMKYPSIVLLGDNSKGETMSLSVASKNQIQDTGAKMIHIGKNTSSQIISKSVSLNGGEASFRSLVAVKKDADKAKIDSTCDALILDGESSSNTYPDNFISNKKAKVNHEASISRLSQTKLFYLTSRGVSEEEAKAMLVNGFIEPIMKQIPLEYAVELNRLIELSMEGSVG